MVIRDPGSDLEPNGSLHSHPNEHTKPSLERSGTFATGNVPCWIHIPVIILAVAADLAGTGCLLSPEP